MPQEESLAAVLKGSPKRLGYLLLKIGIEGIVAVVIALIINTIFAGLGIYDALPAPFALIGDGLLPKVIITLIAGAYGRCWSIPMSWIRAGDSAK